MTSLIFKIANIGATDGLGRCTIRSHGCLGHTFRENYRETIGSDFSLVIFDHEGTKYMAQLWEISPLERFKDSRAKLYRGSAGAILFFDLSRPETLVKLREIVDEFFAIIETPVPVLLIGTKADLIDLQSPPIPSKDIDSFLDYLTKQSGYPVEFTETRLNHFCFNDQLYRLILNIHASIDDQAVPTSSNTDYSVT